MAEIIADIIHDPVKLVMFIILLVMEITAAICLAVAWVKACREAKERKAKDGNL